MNPNGPAVEGDVVLVLTEGAHKGRAGRVVLSTPSGLRVRMQASGDPAVLRRGEVEVLCRAADVWGGR